MMWQQHCIVAGTISGRRQGMQTQTTPDPLWDEGISSYLRGEYDRRGVPLQMSDLQGFAVDQAVRIGDILETLFLMAIYGEWRYTDVNDTELALDEKALNALYAKGRLGTADLEAFDGRWSPAQ